MFVVNFYKKKNYISFLSEILCCAFCVSVSWSFWSSSYFILLLIAFFYFFFLFIFVGYFFWDCVVVVVGGSKRYIYTYISVLAASPNNLLLAFFFLFLYTIFLYISFYDIPYESKASLTEKKVFYFHFIFHSGPIISALPFNICRQ